MRRIERERERERDGRWCGDEAPSTSSYTCRIPDKWYKNTMYTYGGDCGGC